MSIALARRLRSIVKAEVAKYRVPPQMALEVPDPLNPDNENVQITLAARWPDAEGKRPQIATFATRRLTPALAAYGPGDVIRRIIRIEVESMVRELWEHELREWFTYEGQHIRAPHNPDGSFA